MACDLGMMLMSDHDDAYVDAMLMVNMQANTKSVTHVLYQNFQHQIHQIDVEEPSVHLQVCVHQASSPWPARVSLPFGATQPVQQGVLLLHDDHHEYLSWILLC